MTLAPGVRLGASTVDTVSGAIVSLGGLDRYKGLARQGDAARPHRLDSSDQGDAWFAGR